MEPHPVPGGDAAGNRMDEAVTARRPGRVNEGSGLGGSGGGLGPCAGFADDHVAAGFGDEPQPSVARADQQQGIEIVRAIPKSPMEAALPAVAAARDPADQLTHRHPLTREHHRLHGFVRRPHPTMVDGDDRLAADPTGEVHLPRRGRQHRVAPARGQIDAAMAGSPPRRRRVEASDHPGRARDRPTGRGRQARSCRGRSGHGPDSDQGEQEDDRPERSKQRGHAMSLRTRSRIDRPCVKSVDDAFGRPLACGQLPWASRSSALPREARRRYAGQARPKVAIEHRCEYRRA